VAWRYQSHPLHPCFSPCDLAFHNGSADATAWVTVTGVVAHCPDLRDLSAKYRLRAHILEIDGTTHEVDGSLLLQSSLYPEYHYGDELRVSGILQTPPCPDDFCHRDYLPAKASTR